ncbi:high choriolytic enzyme 2-like [Montipora capricornis]|uniref:high choriolytic enzyme 2-like n=1 Tax=Montipora capricornis TaxID=246305 RepID=UPI0035F1537B
MNRRLLVVLLFIKSVFAADHNPDENQNDTDPDLFEGDMYLTREQRYRAEHGMDVDGSPNRQKRGSTTFRNRLWERGVLVYTIDSNLARYSRAKKAISDGMDEWKTKTCIRFRRKNNNDNSYVHFTNGAGCSSYVGRIGGRQRITLNRGCWYRGIVAHEIAHALGFYHEQSRPDRDAYVRINFGNIRANRRNNFLKYPRSLIDSLGTPYDYGSVMHYSSRAFSKNGRPTIVAKKPGVTLGQRQGLSVNDAKEANLLYQQQCPTPTPPTTTVNPVCSTNYATLSEANRERDYGGSNNCDKPLRRRWYRFTGAAGTQMANSSVPRLSCGTHAPGWLRGSHPRIAEGVVQRTVCFTNFGNTCRWKRQIRVVNCLNFYLYKLVPVPFCRLRYCGDDLQGSG